MLLNLPLMCYLCFDRFSTGIVSIFFPQAAWNTYTIGMNTPEVIRSMGAILQPTFNSPVSLSATPRPLLHLPRSIGYILH